MSRHDDTVSLRHIRDYARVARSFIHGRDRADLDTDRMLAFALTRALEVIGNSANRVSPATRALHPSIPWPNIIGLRNRVIHGYDTVNHDILWAVASSELGPLLSAVHAALPPEESDTRS